VRNPLPAFGGVEPESSARVKAAAPVAFRRGLERAVTEDDYAKLAERIPGVARAVATFRWTGSFYTVFVAVDRVGGADVDDAFRALVTDALEPYRIAGYDLEVNGPIDVPLDVSIDVCVAREHFRADVEAAVLDALSSKLRADGSLGFFHPDRFSFGQPLYVSALYAAVMAVEGVDGANVTRLQRWGRTAAGELAQGYVPAGRLEILRLDNDPDAQENGVLSLELGGGK
jgi:predicted phage baseplate assembly protein